MRPLLVLLLTALLLPGLENTNVAPGAEPPVFPEAVPFQATVTVRNPYDRAARIERIDSTCTCTTLRADRTLLLPGGTATLTVEVDNRGKSGIQEVVASVFLTDPEFEPIDIPLRWRIMADITVDALAREAAPEERPADRSWRDVVRYVSHERPDELHRLSKRIRLGSDDPPAGGLQVLGIDYPGDLWTFTPRDLGNGAWLITASARDPQAVPPEGPREEIVTIRTNHPRKPTVTLTFATILDTKAGSQAIDPLAPPF